MVLTVLILALVPAALALIAAATRSHRHRRMWGSAKRYPQPSPAESHRATSGITVVRAADVRASIHSARRKAAAATRDFRLAHVISAVLYGVIVVTTILTFVRLPIASRAAVAYASLAPQLLILAWALHLSPRRASWTYLIYGVSGTLLVSHVAEDAAHTLMWASVFALLIVPALLLLLRRVIDVLTGELVHFHLAGLALAAYFELWAFLSVPFFATRFAFVFAFASSIAALHLLSLRLCRRRPKFGAKHMLLFRAFAGPDEREHLLDDLRDTWRRIGTIQLFAGADVATRTMPPLLAALFTRRRHEHILRDEGDVARLISRFDATIEIDARYPLNAIFSSSAVWKSAVPLLNKNADVVLMDLRGFSAQHAGCIWELEHLRDHRNLRRTVFLIDGSTDFSALETVLRGRTITALDYSRQANEDRRALFDLLLNAAYG